MQLGADADGALLQRALDGQPVDDPGIAALVAHRAARSRRSTSEGSAPARRLRRGAATAPHRRARRLAGSPADRGPAVVRFGRRARLLVAAAAALLVLAGGLGALSRSALPGDRLYPVKQLLDRVVLELHRDPVGLGRAHLDQAREHVAEAEQLVARSTLTRGRGRPGAERGARRRPPADDAVDLARALDAATASSVSGRDGAARGLPLGAAGRCVDLAVRLLRRGRADGRRPRHRSAAARRRGGLAAAARRARAGPRRDAARARGLQHVR